MNAWAYFDKHPWLSALWWGAAFAIALHSSETARVWGEVVRNVVLRRFMKLATSKAEANSKFSDDLGKFVATMTRVGEDMVADGVMKAAETLRDAEGGKK